MTIYNELHRPQFHFSAQENWINDPNGLVCHDGVWHLFFQHNPEACVWGKPVWGHAISDDLMHWQQLEHALYPDEHGAMFSGSVVVDHDNTAGFGEGALLAFYTAAGVYAEPKRRYTQCLAYSTDGGLHWTKFEGNPVVDWIEADNRDPRVIWHADTQQWIMALYLTDDRYCLLRSSNGVSWSRLQELSLDSDHECPDFFSLTDDAGKERWIFWGARGNYYVGSFDGYTFSPETPLKTAEQGRNGYAAQTWSNVPDGRCIQISWMAGGLYPEMPFNQQLSIPVELRLVGTGSDAAIARWPVQEVDPLRRREVHLDRQVVNRESPLVADTNVSLMDVSFTVHKATAQTLYVVVRGQPLIFDWQRQELRFDNGPTHTVIPDRSSVSLPETPEIAVRLLVDRTSIEVFIDEGVISASFCFLPNGYKHPFVLRSYSGEQVITNFTLYELASIW